jgi:hypothetical protein
MDYSNQEKIGQAFRSPHGMQDYYKPHGQTNTLKDESLFRREFSNESFPR